MITYILYKKASPMERETAEFARRLEILGVDNKLVEADSIEGIRISQLYDLMGRPAVVLVRNEGQMVERWQHVLPMAEDVSYLSHL